MSTTVAVKDATEASFNANRNAVDLGYFWARTFFEGLGLSIDPDGHGMVGEHELHDFKRRCDSYTGPHHDHAKRISKLCNDGLCEGATRVFWA